MKRLLGRSGIEVSAMGMGCWAIGGPWTINGNQAGWGDVDDEESIRAIRRALDLGITLFDTAANYGAGQSERILGQALADRRDEVIIATKFGYEVDDGNRRVALYDRAVDSDKVIEYVRRDCEASLRRLGVDCIDLFQFHVNAYPPEKAPKVRDELEAMVAAGKIRFYGWSTDHPESARVFAQGEHCVAIQHQMNVIHDAPEMLKVCKTFDLASIIRGPLARGMLTGKYTADAQFPENDGRSRERFRDRWLIPATEALEKVGAILTSEGRTLAQGALAWVWARSERTIPIPGIRTVAQAEENAKAMASGPLTAEQMAEIDRLLGR
ncbi:MAG: aldo/keto reductase [Anaerolineae bacterium]|jgi:aryl-alcohol dehydrogenase-like predicted oxidoreductase